MGTTWDDIRKSVDGFAKKANRKMEKMTETAAIRIKISAKKAEMEDDYLELGKLAFTSITSGEEVDAQADAITAKVAKIDTLQKEIAALEAKIGKNDEENED